MNASAKREIARQTSKKASYSSQYAQNFDEIVFCDSLSNCLNINSRFCGGCADLPKDKNFNISPDFKGIKTRHPCRQNKASNFNISPDFKGIKTTFSFSERQSMNFNISPDFKGIKTGA